MKTLPDAIIAGMAGGSDRVILVRIIPESGDTWAEFDWATKDITVLDWEGDGSSKSFAGNMLAKGKLGTIRQSVDIEQGGNVATISNLTISVANPQFNGENRFDQEVDTYNFENRKVEVWLAFWTGSNPAYTDILLLYSGVVADTECDYKSFEFKVEAEKKDKEIPDLILSKDDYTVIPVYNRGKTIPLVYGDLTTGDARISTLNMVPVIRVDKGKEQFVIARNKVDDFTPAVYLYFSGVNRWVLLTPDSGSFSLTRARPSKLNFPLGTNILGKLETQLEIQGSQTLPTGLNVGNAIDESWSTVIQLVELEGVHQLLYLKAPMPPEFGRTIDEIYTAKLYVQFGTIPDDGSNGRIKYYNPEADSFSEGQSYDHTDSGDLVSYEITGKTWDQLSSYEYGVTCYNGTCEVANMYLVIEDIIVKMTTNKVTWFLYRKWRRSLGRHAPSPIFVEHFNELRESDNVALNLDGGEFGSWIDADSRDNGYNEGNLISRPSCIIEAILRDELGLSSDEIDYDSFDDLGNTTDGERKDWVFGNKIDSISSSRNIIEEICKQAGIIYIENYENKAKVITLKEQTEVKTIDRTTIQENSIKRKFTKLENVYNEFYLNYDKSWVSGSFNSTRFLNASTTNMSSNSRSGTPNTYTGLCTDSQSKIANVRRLTIDCDWIRDDTTIDLLMKWLAEWFCYRKLIWKHTTAGLDDIGLELSDQLKIDHTLMPTALNNSTHFLLFDIAHNLDRDRMTFKFMQIPELLP